MAGRVLILEPALRDIRGHHADAAARFATLIGNDRTVIIGGVGWRGTRTLGGATVRPLFRFDRAEVARRRRYGRVVARSISLAERVAEPLVALIRQQRGRFATEPEFTMAAADAASTAPILAAELARCWHAAAVDADDRVFIPSGDAEFVLAVAALLNSSDDLPFIHLRLMYDDFDCHRTDPTWRSALRLLVTARHATNRVRLLAETRAFANAAEIIWGRPVAQLPHPSRLGPAPVPGLTDSFNIYVAGQARADKGFHRIAGLVRALSARLATDGGMPVRLTIQGVTVPGRDHVEVRQLPMHLSAVDYEANWQQTHVALLLHDPTVYALRGSGVACDALASGRPFVYLEGATVGEWGARGNALDAAPNPDAIAHAIVEVLRNYQRYESVATIAAADFPRVVRAGLAGILDTAAG